MVHDVTARGTAASTTPRPAPGPAPRPHPSLEPGPGPRPGPRPAPGAAPCPAPGGRDPAATWSDVLGPRAAEELARHALVVLTPDAVLGDRVLAAVELVEDAGLRVVAAAPTWITPERCAALWPSGRAELGADRYAVCERVLGHVESLVLLVRDDRPDLPRTGEPDASQRLAALKGAADPAARGPTTLRARLGSPHGVLRVVHVPDSSADMLHDLAALLDDDAAVRFLTDARDDPDAALRRVVEAVGASRPPHGTAGRSRLAVPAGVATGPVWRATCARCSVDPAHRHEVLTTLLAHVPGGPAAALADVGGSAALELDDWEVLVLAAHLAALPALPALPAAPVLPAGPGPSPVAAPDPAGSS